MSQPRRIPEVPDLVHWPVNKAHTPHGHGDCRRCGGRCCTYLAVQIPAPANAIDVDEVRWFLAHRNLEVFIEEGNWFVQFYTPCEHLAPDGRCAIYEDRFDVCRRHSVTECEMTDGEVDVIAFSTTAQFDRWWAQEQARRQRRRKRFLRQPRKVIYRRKGRA